MAEGIHHRVKGSSKSHNDGEDKPKVTRLKTNHPSRILVSSSRRWTKTWTICKLVLSLIFVTFLALYAYNKREVSREAVLYARAPETMVKLSTGHSLYLNCQGNIDPDQPILVLVMGFIGPQIIWYPYQTRLAEKLRTCAYDRSGIAWSEPHPDRWVTVQGFIDELHELIEVSGISKNPSGYILMGISMGASIVSRYIEQWPEETKAGYMMDPPLESTSEQVPQHHVIDMFKQIKMLFTVFKYLGEWGILRPVWYFFPKMQPLSRMLATLPEQVADEYIYLASKSGGYYTGLIHELGLIDPGHGHFTNSSTVQFLANYDKIPLYIELREAAFGFGFSSEEVDKEWYNSRQKLKQILKGKQETFQEDHMGHSSAAEPAEQAVSRVYRRMEKFLANFVKNRN